MTKHRPDYHSPLLSLGRKILLLAILPAALVLTVLYVVDRQSPARQHVDRVAQEVAKNRVAALKPIEGMGSQQSDAPGLSEDELKKVAAMSEKERGEFVRKRNQEAEERVKTSPQRQTTCDNNKLAQGRGATLAGTPPASGSGPYGKLKFKSTVPLPKGSVVKDPYDKVIGTCEAEPCNEINLTIDGSGVNPGRMSVYKDKDAADGLDAPYVTVLPRQDMNCIRTGG